MKTASLKTLLDAMAFANVNNLGEFRALLRQVERPADAVKANSDDSLPPADGSRVTTLPNALGAL